MDSENESLSWLRQMAEREARARKCTVALVKTAFFAFKDRASGWIPNFFSTVMNEPLICSPIYS